MLVGHVRAGDDAPTGAIPVLYQRLAQAVIAGLASHRPDVITCNRGYTNETITRAGVRVRHVAQARAIPVQTERVASIGADDPHVVRGHAREGVVRVAGIGAWDHVPGAACYGRKSKADNQE